MKHTRQKEVLQHLIFATSFAKIWWSFRDGTKNFSPTLWFLRLLWSRRDLDGRISQRNGCRWLKRVGVDSKRTDESAKVSWGLSGLIMRPKTLCATRWRSIERRKSRMAIPGCQSATCIIGTRWRQSGTSMIHYRWIIPSTCSCMRRNWTPLIDEKVNALFNDEN